MEKHQFNMSTLSIENLATGIQLNIPTGTMCRNASRFLNSIISMLPNGTQEFIQKYPYTSALIFTLGADSVIWIKSCERGGDYLLMEIRNANHRDQGFPIYETVESRIYAKELSLIAELGFNYEVNYLRENGFDMSEYEYHTPENSIKHNEALFSEPENIFPGRIEEERLATMYFHTKDDVEMLEDGYGHVPELLSEKMSILKEILDNHGVCYDGRLITKHGYLPGKIQIVSQVVECLIPEERYNDNE